MDVDDKTEAAEMEKLPHKLVRIGKHLAEGGDSGLASAMLLDAIVLAERLDGDVERLLHFVEHYTEHDIPWQDFEDSVTSACCKQCVIREEKKESVATLQSRNTVLEQDWKKMKTGLELISNAYHEQSAYLDSNGQVAEAHIAKNILESLHHSPESV